MTARCMDCGGEFIPSNGWEDLCPRCVAIELTDLRADADDYYPMTRTERLRERLGVSGNVDE